MLWPSKGSYQILQQLRIRKIVIRYSLKVQLDHQRQIKSIILESYHNKLKPINLMLVSHNKTLSFWLMKWVLVVHSEEEVLPIKLWTMKIQSGSIILWTRSKSLSINLHLKKKNCKISESNTGELAIKVSGGSIIEVNTQRINLINRDQLDIPPCLPSHLCLHITKIHW